MPQNLPSLDDFATRDLSASGSDSASIAPEISPSGLHVTSGLLKTECTTSKAVNTERYRKSKSCKSIKLERGSSSDLLIKGGGSTSATGKVFKDTTKRKSAMIARLESELKVC